MESSLIVAEKVLTTKELELYNKYIESGKPSLAPSTAGEMFALFLNGHSCSEIAKLNPGFGVGIILKARIDFSWDKEREEHVQNLLDNIRQVAQKTQLDAIRFVSDGLSVYQKMVGEKFQKYLQSGEIEDLGEERGFSFKQYKDLLDILLKLTGQDSQKKVSGEVLHRHQVEQTNIINEDRPITSDEATDFLKQLQDENKK